MSFEAQSNYQVEVDTLAATEAQSLVEFQYGMPQAARDWSIWPGMDTGLDLALSSESTTLSNSPSSSIVACNGILPMTSKDRLSRSDQRAKVLHCSHCEETFHRHGLLK